MYILETLELHDSSGFLHGQLPFNRAGPARMKLDKKTRRVDLYIRKHYVMLTFLS